MCANALQLPGGGWAQLELSDALFSVIFELYPPRDPMNITFSRGGRSAKPHFPCVVYSVFACSSILFDVHI